MAEISHEEKEDLEVKLAQLEQTIGTLTMLVTHLVENDK